MIKNVMRSAAAIIATLFTAGVVCAQCDVWIPTRGDSTLSNVRAFAVVDADGNGPGSPRLYAGINRGVGSIGVGLKSWDGLRWSDAAGVNSNVTSLLAIQGGVAGVPSGSVVVGCGYDASFDSGLRKIAVYDGNSLIPIGPSAATDFSATTEVLTLTTWDPDGDGPLQPRVVAGGNFSRFGGVAATNIAMWDGTSWRPIGSGIVQPVYSLVSFDPDGSGPATPLLVAATASTGFAVLSWNGTTWQQMGPVFNSRVNAVTVHDADGDGPGLPDLYAGGQFSATTGVPTSTVARWNGTEWIAAGTGGLAAVYTLLSHDPDGAGPLAPVLVAGGGSSSAPADTVAILSSGAWTIIPLSGATVRALVTFDPDGSMSRGTTLIASSGPSAWDGQSWGRLGSEFEDGRIQCFYYYENAGEESGLYAGGSFTSVGGRPADGLAKWDGQQWIGLGSPTPQRTYVRSVYEMVAYDIDGDGPLPTRLTAVDGGIGVPFPLMQWVNGAWAPLGVKQGSTDPVVGRGFRLVKFDDDGPGSSPARLFAGGSFDIGGLVVLNGDVWSQVASNSFYYPILLEHDDDGAGPNLPSLYSSPDVFTSDVLLGWLRRWNGSTMEFVHRVWTDNSASGSPTFFSRAASWDFDGEGPSTPELIFGSRRIVENIVSGTSVTSYAAYTAAAFDGQVVRQLGTDTFAVDRYVRGLGTFDPDGTGPVAPQLILGYSKGNGRAVQRLVGEAWTDMGQGLSNQLD